MKLTKFDLVRLRNFQRARECAPTPRYGLWRVKWHILILCIIAAIGFFLPPRFSMFGCFILGLCAGGMISIVTFAFILPRFWPLTREILNWDRIAELIKEQDDHAA
jgi:hypothetical protein